MLQKHLYIHSDTFLQVRDFNQFDSSNHIDTVTLFLNHHFLESDYFDLRSTLVSKLEKFPLISASCRESASMTLCALSTVHQSHFASLIRLLNDSL